MRIRSYESPPPVGENPKRAFDVQWSRAAFEFFNLENARAYDALRTRVLVGALDRDGWIRGVANLEYIALRKKADFYKASWSHWMQARRIRSNPALWGVSIPDSYEEWLSTFTNPQGYPWGVYGPDYDRLIAGKRMNSK